MASRTNERFRPLEALRRILRSQEPGYVPDLSSPERLVLIALVGYADRSGQCWPSLTTLAKGTGLCRASIASALGRLDKLKLICRRKRPRPQSTHYTITLSDLGVGSPGDGLVQEMDYPEPDEVVQEVDQLVQEMDQGSPGDGPEVPKEVSTKCLKEVAAPPVPAPDPRSWTQRAGEIWTEALGGPAPHGRIGKAFKPLVRAHGAEDVLATWRRYLTTEPGQFVTPEQFASKYQVWRDGRRTGSRLAEVDVDDLAGWDRLQRGDQP